MRIERIHVDAFGRLGSFDTGSATLSPLVVVLGPNEAGKSTLFSFLTTALYGFHPASRDRNPHVPWGGDEASGRIVVRLEGSGCAVVERRLRSAPSARLTRGDVAEELRNQPLPWVDHIPRAVFEQVYAVTLADLAGLDEATWSRIQDRVLGSMGATDLRSARDVADALEQEAGEIWRPNRRGNQRLRDLRDRIRDLRARRAESLERDRRVRSLVEELENAGLHLRDLKTTRQLEKIVVERATELLPVKRALERVAALRAAAGAPDLLAALGPDPAQRLAELRDDLSRARARLAELERAHTAAEAVVADHDERSRRIVEARIEIRRLVSRAANAALDRERADALRAEASEHRLRMQTVARRLLEEPVTPAVEDRLLAVPLDLLEDRIRRLERRAADADPEGRAEAPSHHAGVSVALLVGGAALAAWGLGSGLVWAAVAGAAAAGVGLARLLSDGRGGGRGGPRRHPGEEAADVRRQVEEMLTGLTVRSEYTDPPEGSLVTALRDVREHLEARRRVEASAAALEARLASLDEAARTLAVDRLDAAEGRAEDIADVLDRALAEAEGREHAAERARTDLVEVAREREVVERRLRTSEVDAEELVRHAEAATGRSGPDAVDEACRRRAAHTEADRIESDLRRSRPDLDAVREQIRKSERDGVDWSIADEELAERKERIESLDDEVETLAGRVSALERDIAHLRDEETVDAVDSEIATLKEAERELVRERDRKWVLAHLVREADRRFREEHQPDLVRRASEYLARLTAGRYDRLLVDERGEGDLFRLVGPGLPAPVPLARPISTGTLEQAYLSLRLAIVDHLDQDREPLPLFIDEGFVNWDARRRDRGLEVLAEVSERRQVFSFTCHPEMAERLAGLGACVVRLP